MTACTAGQLTIASSAQHGRPECRGRASAAGRVPTPANKDELPGNPRT